MAKTVNQAESVGGMSHVTAEYMDADDLEALTGTPASTWRYWAWRGEGPKSFLIGKRRVWRVAVVNTWLLEQELAAEQKTAAGLT